MTTIGILEDDRLLRSVLGDVLTTRGQEVSISAGTVQEFLERASKRHMDCAVLDLHLGAGASGVDVANKLRSIYPKLGIVILSSFHDPRLAGVTFDSFPEGTIYIEKSSVQKIEVLEKAIEDAIRRVERSENNSLPGTLAALSENQIEVLRLVAQGFSNSEIARKKNSSEKTIESSLTKIAKLLEIPSDSVHNKRVQMARIYFRARGVEVED